MALEGKITRRMAKRLAISYEMLCRATDANEWDRVPALAKMLLDDQEEAGIILMNPNLLSRLIVTAGRVAELDREED